MKGRTLGLGISQRMKSQGKGKPKPALSADAESLPAVEGEAGDVSTPLAPVTPLETEGDTAAVEQTAAQEENDAWRRQFYNQSDSRTSLVCTTVAAYKASANRRNGHELHDKSPLMLLDSGASVSVAGKNGCRVGMQIVRNSHPGRKSVIDLEMDWDAQSRHARAADSPIAESRRSRQDRLLK